MMNEQDIENIDAQKRSAHRIDYEDSCEVSGCENEVILDDYGMVLCAEHCKLPEYREAMNRLAEKEAFMDCQS